MITVAIIAILAAVALPSYTDYLRRGQLPAAFTALSDYRVKMEQYYQDNRNYGMAACADTNPPAWNTFAPQGHFTLGCAVAAGGQAFTLTATGAVGAARGHVYTLNSSNVQGTTSFKGVAVSGRSCWLVTGNEC
jgi:type IV pilus assembly protein PilE